MNNKAIEKCNKNIFVSFFVVCCICKNTYELIIFKCRIDHKKNFISVKIRTKKIEKWYYICINDVGIRIRDRSYTFFLVFIRRLYSISSSSFYQKYIDIVIRNINC